MIRFLGKIVFVLLFAFMVSCEKAGETIFEGPYHARFTESESSIVENYADPFNLNQNEPLSIELHIAAPSPTSTTIIEYEVSGSAQEKEES